MRLLVLFLIGMLLINMGLVGHIGSYIGSLLTPEYMVEI